jgi:hypothetical protein
VSVCPKCWVERQSKSKRENKLKNQMAVGAYSGGKDQLGRWQAGQESVVPERVKKHLEMVAPRWDWKEFADGWFVARLWVEGQERRIAAKIMVQRQVVSS